MAVTGEPWGQLGPGEARAQRPRVQGTVSRSQDDRREERGHCGELSRKGCSVWRFPLTRRAWTEAVTTWTGPRVGMGSSTARLALGRVRTQLLLPWQKRLKMARCELCGSFRADLPSSDHEPHVEKSTSQANRTSSTHCGCHVGQVRNERLVNIAMPP